VDAVSEDYILIGGGLLIALVIMHGLWLAWRARQDPLPLDIESDVPDDDFDVDELGAEFPNGGARVVAEHAAPTQRPLAFEGPVPVLMEVVDESETNPGSVDVDVHVDKDEAASGPENGSADTDGNGRGTEPIIAEASDSIAPARISRGLRNEQRPAQREREAARREARREDRREARRDPADVAANAEESEVLAINVLARGDRRFNGSDLWAAFQRNGLTFGDMNIFHRLNPVTRTPQYSVANAIEPGTFDLSDMESMKTPGACLFLRLPGPSEPAAVFDDMLRVARDIEQSLDGELKDENFSVLTGQTEQHYRQRIAEFSRKRMSKRY
jgi:cell division protein ZipA